MLVKKFGNHIKVKTVEKANAALGMYQSGEIRPKKIVSKKGKFKVIRVGLRYRLISPINRELWKLISHEQYNRFTQ